MWKIYVEEYSHWDNFCPPMETREAFEQSTATTNSLVSIMWALFFLLQDIESKKKKKN